MTHPMKFSKVIDLEDFSNEELAPYFHAIAKKQMPSFDGEKPHIQPDTINWRTALALYSFEKNNLLQAGKSFAGIGVGTDRMTEYLANKGAIVFPVDRYLEASIWSDTAPGGFMMSTSNYTYSDTNPQNIIPVHSDARALELPSNFFDGVYSSGSIEHFGGLDAVEAASFEMGRVLKPGGFASISTEFKLDGPEGLPWIDDHCILFTPDLISKHIIEPSGLTPIGIPNIRPSEKTFATRKVIIDFLSSTKEEITFRDRLDIYPNLIRFHDGFLFCSVHLLLQKPHDWKPVKQAQLKSDNYRKQIRTKNRSIIESTKNLTPDKEASFIFAEKKELKKNWITTILSQTNSMLKKTPRLRFFVLKILSRFPNLDSFLRIRLNRTLN